MPEGNTHESIDTALKKPLTRRHLLKLGAQTAALGAAAIATSKIPDVIHSNRLQINKPKVPEVLPDDILMAEQLKEANIRIDSTEGVKLHLRRSALGMEPFKKGAKEKSGGVVIVLVDNDVLSWNEAEKMQGDAKDIFQAGMVNAAELDPDYLADYPKMQETELSETIQWLTRDLEDIKAGRMEQKLKDGIVEYEKKLAKNPNDNIVKYLLDAYKVDLEEFRSGIFEVSRKRWLKESNEELEKVRQLQGKPTIEIINFINDQDKGFGYYVDGNSIITSQSIVLNEHVDLQNPYPQHARYQKIVEEHPEWLNKTYIYLCVGGDRKPHPAQSYPGPDDLVVTNDSGYHVIVKGEQGTTAGYVLWHETGHSRDPIDGFDEKNEHNADEVALKGIVNAWTHFQKTGNDKKYPFVFETDEGITITKKVKPEEENQILQF